MKVACRVFGYSQLALLLFLVIGCGGGDDRVLVSGMVTLDGNPLDGAGVTFLNTETNKGGSGLTNAEGIYRVRVSPGEYKVAIGKMEGGEEEATLSQDEQDMLLMNEFEVGIEELDEKNKAQQLIPDRFSVMADTILTCSVPKGGKTDADFTNLTSK